MNKHHCLPKSREGSDDKSNILRLPEKFHCNLHRVFKNKTPTEQLKLVLEINGQVFQEKFSKDIFLLLQDWEGYELKQGILIKK